MKLLPLAFGLAAVAPAAAQTPQVAALPPVAPATIAPMTVVPKPVPTDYVLGPADSIEISLRGQGPTFEKVTTRIRADGTVALPFLGDFKAAGETPLTCAARIAAALEAKGLYVKPIVSVEVVGFASRYVIVLGELGQVGLQPIDRPYRVSEIVARAGGIKDSGADYIMLRRTGGQEIKLPFDKLATGGDADDPVVQSGDKIYVPPVDRVYISGQVAAPGVVPLKGPMTLRTALARSGGITQLGSEKRVEVFRNGVKAPLRMDDAVLAGDVIVVGQRLF